MAKAKNPNWMWIGADPTDDMDDEDAPRPARGALTSMEEMDIAHAPRPVTQPETPAQRTKRQAATDKAHRPEDRIPLALHESRTLSAIGTPQLAEAFLRYLSGEAARTETDRRLALVLAELERSHRVLWAVLAERYVYNRSQEEIAGELFLGQKTVSRMLIAGTAWIQRRFAQLYQGDS